MNVSSIGQGPGSVLTLPGLQTSGTDAPSSSRGSPDAAQAVEPPVDGPETDATVVRLAWFDLNGDGKIDSRSSLAGGDGTLIVPREASHPQIFSHAVTRRPVANVDSDREERARSSRVVAPDLRAERTGPANVQTRQAISAYQRYGQPTDDATTAHAVA